MSLIEMSLSTVVKRQYSFKLKSYVRVFSSMIVMQILGILFSLNGTGGFSGGSNSVNIDGTYYTADTVIFLTLMWAFMTALLITTKAYRYDDFTFVTNRAASHLSNMLFLLTSSVFGGLMAVLSGFLIKDIIYYFFHTPLLKGADNHTLSIFLTSVFATCLYALLVSACGYFFGTLIQIHKLFIVIVPGLIIGTSLINGGNDEVFARILKIFYGETSMFLFFIKIVITVGLLFVISMLISNRMEVKQ